MKYRLDQRNKNSPPAPARLHRVASKLARKTIIHNNPVEEGLVFKAEHYVYSSAIDYAGEKGLLDIVLI